MVRNVLETIQGIEIYPLISFVIFFSFFVILIVSVIRMKKEYIDEISRLPLDDDSDTKLDSKIPEVNNG
jgi:cytochrome c oxidase cbb3-type subunit IV